LSLLETGFSLLPCCRRETGAAKKNRTREPAACEAAEILALIFIGPKPLLAGRFAPCEAGFCKIRHADAMLMVDNPAF